MGSSLSHLFEMAGVVGGGRREEGFEEDQDLLAVDGELDRIHKSGELRMEHHSERSKQLRGISGRVKIDFLSDQSGRQYLCA